MIYIGQFHHKKVGSFSIETSSEEQFLERTTELNARFSTLGIKAPAKRWKIRTLG